jgi:hypothetical protein
MSEIIVRHTQSTIRRMAHGLASLAGAAGIAMLVPAAILAIGLPLAVLARAIGAVLGWLLA